MTLLNNNPINHVDSRESHLWSDESQLIHSIPGAGRKVSDGMRQRLAVVYVRQSSQQQVLDHRESTQRQYAMKQWPIAWGWASNRVIVIDQDLGKSATSDAERPGFQRLLAEVKCGNVGIVLGLEISRLVRRYDEWALLYHLCEQSGTGLADQDGVYDPRDFNDRLILRVKSLMNEMEIHVMRSRMQQGRRNKAERAELFIAVPTGYLRRPDNHVELDPDEQARATVRLLFEKFDELGTAGGVYRYLRQHDVRLPVRPHTGRHRGELQWRVATQSTVSKILRHPIYAGVYVSGQRAAKSTRPALASNHASQDAQQDAHQDAHQDARQDASNHAVDIAPPPPRPEDEWDVFLPDKLPAYITLGEYRENRRRMASNARGPNSPGTASKGAAWLSGLVVCGRCGRRLQVAYTGRNQANAYYHCARPERAGLVESCHGLPARLLDDLVATEVLRAISPASLEASLQAAANVEQERLRLEQHRLGRVERARYECQRAERQYDLAEPENRQVVRTLEARWNTALDALQVEEEELARFRQGHGPSAPSVLECEAIRQLASDVPGLWACSEMTHQERSELIRSVVDRVVVRVVDDSEHVDVTLHWAGGFASPHALVRPVGTYSQLRDYGELLDRIGELRSSGHTACSIASELSASGFRDSRGGELTASQIRHLWTRLASEGLSDCEWELSRLSLSLGVNESRLRDWLRRGWLRGRKWKGRWVAWADASESSRLQELASAYSTGGRFGQYDSRLTTPISSTTAD